MGIYKADQNQSVFFYESGTYASISGDAQWIGQVQEVSIDEEVNTIRNRFQGTATRNVDQFLQGPRDFTGTITYQPQDWKFMMFALGSNVDAGSPSPFSHTISETNSDDGNAFTSGLRCPFISFGMEVSQTAQGTGQNFNRDIIGGNVSTLTLAGTAGEVLTNTVDFVAQNATFSSGTRATVTDPATRPFLWDDVSIQFVSGISVENLMNFEFSINNNPNAQHFLNGSKVIDSPTMDNREYQLTVTVEGNSQQTKQFYDQFFLGGSEFNAIIDITDATAGAGSRDAFFTLSGCEIVDMDAPNPLEGTNEQTITVEPKSVSILVNDTIENYNGF